MKPSGGDPVDAADAVDVIEAAVGVPAQPHAPDVEAVPAGEPDPALAGRPGPPRPPGPSEPPASPGLTEREREILAFEQRWWRRPGSKEQAIRDTFELSATRYYQLLNALLDNPAALAHDPVLVGRLRRLRTTRTRR